MNAKLQKMWERGMVTAAYILRMNRQCEDGYELDDETYEYLTLCRAVERHHKTDKVGGCYWNR